MFKLFIALTLTANCFAETIVTHHWHKGDSYEYRLLKLALDKTGGDYRLQLSANMSQSRVAESMANNSYTNFIQALTISPRTTLLEYIPFPINRGLFGYRVCFHSKRISGAVNNIQSLNDLLRFTQAVGIGWADNEILTHNGFKVRVGIRSSLLELTGMNRIDLFCRSIGEVHNEFTNNKLKSIQLDKKFAIHYPSPVFFYSNPNNKYLLHRVREGLLIAYKDGSFIELWEKFFRKSLEFSAIHTRRVFELDNPLLDNVDLDYMKYAYRFD